MARKQTQIIKQTFSHKLPEPDCRVAGNGPPIKILVQHMRHEAYIYQCNSQKTKLKKAL